MIIPIMSDWPIPNHKALLVSGYTLEIAVYEDDNTMSLKPCEIEPWKLCQTVVLGLFFLYKEVFIPSQFPDKSPHFRFALNLGMTLKILCQLYFYPSNPLAQMLLVPQLFRVVLPLAEAYQSTLVAYSDGVVYELFWRSTRS